MAIWFSPISISNSVRVSTIGKHTPVSIVLRASISTEKHGQQWMKKASRNTGVNTTKHYYQHTDLQTLKSSVNRADRCFSTSTHHTQRGSFRGSRLGSGRPLLQQFKSRNRSSLHTPLTIDHLSRPTQSWYGHARLTPTQVNSILRRYEGYSKVERRDGSSLYFVSNQLPSNAPIEDRRAKARCDLSDSVLFGVFDGHRGPACAQAISERLVNYIAAEALPYEDLLKAHKMFETGEMKEMVEWFHHPNDYTSHERQYTYRRSLQKYLEDNVAVDMNPEPSSPEDHITESLITAFERLDKDLSMEALTPSSAVMYDEALHTVFSGACACIAYIDGDDVYVANAGDCRAVLGSRDSDGFWLAHSMSNDHNAHNNDEVLRIKAVHPPNESNTVIKNGRLLSELAPLRAFGDVRYKWASDTQRNVLNPWFGSNVVPRSYHTPPYLVATPEVKHHKLEQKDKFLILATDGLWDCITPQKAVTLVGDHLLLQQPSANFESQKMKLGDIKRHLGQRKDAIHPRDRINAATHLIRYAVGGSQSEFDHDRLAHSLSLPDDVSRQYRDDITVIIVYF